MALEVTKKDSELHSTFAQFLNQNARWDGMPTGNVGALDTAFKWFNEIGQRIDAALEAEEKAKVEKEAAELDPKTKKVSFSTTDATLNAGQFEQS